MGSEDGWIDIAAAAERESCSPQVIRRRIKAGVLTARIEGSTARDGRHVVKAWVRVSELDEVFGHEAREEHVRRIRATAQPLTRDQKIVLRKVLLDHLAEKEAKRTRRQVGGEAEGCLQGDLREVSPGGLSSRHC